MHPDRDFARPFRGLLSGLSYSTGGGGSAYVSTTADKLRGGPYGKLEGSYFPLHTIKPLLLDFAALATPLTLPSGEVVVPWERLLEIALPAYERRNAVVGSVPVGDKVYVAGVHGGAYHGDQLKRVHLTPDDQMSVGGSGLFNLPIAAFDYLRSLHFAVGLDPKQYVRKEVVGA